MILSYRKPLLSGFFLAFNRYFSWFWRRDTHDFWVGYFHGRCRWVTYYQDSSAPLSLYRKSLIYLSRGLLTVMIVKHKVSTLTCILCNKWNKCFLVKSATISSPTINTSSFMKASVCLWYESMHRLAAERVLSMLNVVSDGKSFVY